MLPRFGWFAAATCLLLAPGINLADAQERRLPSGNATIRGKVGDDEIVITTTKRLAGAIHSLTFRGQEYIDSVDHGRQLQSASNFDVGGPFFPETFNPTEAGSRRDGAGDSSSSRLLHLLARGNQLQTTSQMAFWLTPDEKSAGHPAKNTTVLSNHTLTKRVQIGFRDIPDVIQYDVTFGLPIGEQHTLAQFEVVTGYMPPVFEKFLKYNSEQGKLEPLDDGPGEQPWPVVLATADGRHAMGCYSPDTFGAGWSGPGYGRFRFERERVVKWNCVFRYRHAKRVPAGDYSFRTFVVVGDVDTVTSRLNQLQSLRVTE